MCVCAWEREGGREGGMEANRVTTAECRAPAKKPEQKRGRTSERHISHQGELLLHVFYIVLMNVPGLASTNHCMHGFGLWGVCWCCFISSQTAILSVNLLEENQVCPDFGLTTKPQSCRCADLDTTGLILASATRGEARGQLAKALLIPTP